MLLAFKGIKFCAFLVQKTALYSCFWMFSDSVNTCLSSLVMYLSATDAESKSVNQTTYNNSSSLFPVGSSSWGERNYFTIDLSEPPKHQFLEPKSMSSIHYNDELNIKLKLSSTTAIAHTKDNRVLCI